MSGGRITLSSDFGQIAPVLRQTGAKHALQAIARNAEGTLDHDPRGNYVPTAEERLAILDEVMTTAASKGLLQHRHRRRTRSTAAPSR